MHKLFFLLFSTFIFGQNIPKDSVSFDYFCKKEMQTIVQLKKELVNKKFNASKQIALAELYANINCEDSAYATFYNVYEKEKVKKTLSDEHYKQLLFELHHTESSKKNYNRDRRFFLNELKFLSKKDSSDKWFAKIEYENFKDLFADSLKYKMAFGKIKTVQKTNFYKTNAEFKATTLLGLGNLYTSLNQFDLAENALTESLQLSTKNNDGVTKIYALINLGINEREKGNYAKALFYLSQADVIPQGRYRIKIARIVASQKQLIFTGLNDTIAANQQKNLFQKLDNLVNDFAKNSNFYEIDVKFQTKQKDAKINELNDLENRFVRNKILYGILIFLVFLLGLYSFIRWKKVDKSKRFLTIEKEKAEKETIEIKAELESVKQLVIENFIILKNKSKVYLSELVYIKSEEHYLNLITLSKKEFVRGKVSEIITQLPSNFVKCHRSFIVNKNYIKQVRSRELIMKNDKIIPTSRGFKL
jgi:hypothetical protein